MDKRGATALAAQALAMAALAAATALLGLVLGGRALAAVRIVAVWLVSAGAGGALALLCGRRGIPAILAWPLGPGAWALAYLAAAGMAPPPGGLLWIILCSVVGASAGEVLATRQEKKGKETRR